MCYENTKNVFEIARGFLHVVIMDMHAAGRMALHRGRGVVKHGTLRTATDGAVFFAFGVFASDSPPDREPQTAHQGISTGPVTAVEFASITSKYELELEKRVLYAL
jgi:hypothetical protein